MGLFLKDQKLQRSFEKMKMIIGTGNILLVLILFVLAYRLSVVMKLLHLQWMSTTLHFKDFTIIEDHELKEKNVLSIII